MKSFDDTSPNVRSILSGQLLDARFQPVVDIARQSVHAHEGLIRGPAGGPLHEPAALFAAGRVQGIEFDLEIAAAERIVDSFSGMPFGGGLFLNFSAAAIARFAHGDGSRALGALVDRAGLPPRRLVVDITQHQHVGDQVAFAAGIARLREFGVGLALDDFGDIHSSLKVWAELRPDYVRIDRYFCQGIHTNDSKLQAVKAIVRLAEAFGSSVVAEGLEDAADLTVIRDLGIAHAQGYFLGCPAPVPAAELALAAAAVLGTREIAVFPEVRGIGAAAPHIGKIVIAAPSVPPHTTNEKALEIFNANPHLHALPIVLDGAVLGLLNRRRLTDQYARPYYRELYGRRPVTLFMNETPHLVELSESVDRLLDRLLAGDQHYLSDGVVITDQGRYAGIATGEQIVRALTEVRIETARHANPLTFLPGNIPISRHVERLLASCNPFVAAYCDLNHFKPFNDQFGYGKGDEMIRLLAAIVVAECEPQRDFVGHVGGDDFVLLFQSADWHARCERIVQRFNRLSPDFFDTRSRELGYLEGEDRQGQAAVYPLTTLSIGAIRVAPGVLAHPEDVAAAAAAAKRRAKQRRQDLHVEDLRGRSDASPAPWPVRAKLETG